MATDGAVTAVAVVSAMVAGILAVAGRLAGSA